jgi:hypothetical protein
LTEIVRNAAQYPTAYRRDEAGREWDRRVFRVRAATGAEAVADAEIPPRGEAWPGNPALRVVSEEAEPDGGDWWAVTVHYATEAAGAGGGEPAPLAGTLYSVFGYDSGQIIAEFDLDGQPLRDGGVAVDIRLPRVTVVHHRPTPLDPAIVLGLIGEPGEAIKSPVNHAPLAVPPFQWENPSAPGTTFNAGELRYLGSVQQFARNGLWIVRHEFSAAPDHLAHWWEDGVRRSATVYPEADLSVLW